MTNKDKYIKSIDKLKADEYLKRSVLSKIQEKPKKSFYFKLANVAIIMIFVISCTFLIAENNNKNNFANSIYKNQPIARMNSKIKSVENEENLKSILSVAQETRIINDQYYEATTDSLIANQAEVRKSENEFSKTNLQEDGIDEADIVKTDGNYIYYSGINNRVVIVDANLNQVAEIKLEEDGTGYGGVQEIYVNGNKLIVITQKQTAIYSTEIINSDAISYNIPQTLTKVRLYNVEDKSNVVKERELELEGNYVSSRMIDENVYIITNQTINTESENLRPTYRDSITDNSEKLVNYEDMYYIENENIKQYLNIAGFNVNKNEEVKVQSFLGIGDTVYANENNLYVAGTKYVFDENAEAIMRQAKTKTQVCKFKLIDSQVEFKEFVELEGTIINQFAMDEQDGYLRIATTSSENNTTSNNIFVFDARLQEVGKLTNIAEGERIYSVRYIDNKAYMVTYEEVDPLFVIDLSNPNSPQILGELKIPGYSTYLHPYDETHLIGIGEETTVLENGDTDVLGLKISLYDVSDVNSPKETSKFVIEGDNVYTEALHNHKALLFIKEKGILAFPMSISTGPKSAFYGTEILTVDLENGVQEKGRIASDETGSDYKKYIDRVIYIGENLYNISKSGIVANNMETLEQTGRVDF